MAVAEVSEEMGAPHNPFQATVGLRIEPAPEESGIRYGREVELGSPPLAFHEAVEEAVRDALAQGLFGWPVTGCRVVMTRAGYNSITSTAGDFRHLARMVVMTALVRAQTAVLEPAHRFQLEVPEPTAGTVLGLLVRRRGVAEQVKTGTGHVHLEGVIPAREIADLRRELPGRSRGEGVLVTEFDRYLPVQGDPPARPRTGPDPSHREAYLMWVRRVREV